MVVWRGCFWEYERFNDHGRLRSVWPKSLEGLVMEERLDLLPRERGGGVGGSAVADKSSVRADGPWEAELVDCGGWGTVMATSVRRVLSGVLASWISSRTAGDCCCVGWGRSSLWGRGRI